MSHSAARLASTVLATRDARRLASFYENLLGWVRVVDDANWVKLLPAHPETGVPDRGSAGLSFHHDVGFRPPTWPTTADEPPMTAHLDLAVADLDDGVTAAVALGARLADYQPQADVRVLLDPDGHPFCLFPDSDNSAGT